MRIQSSINAINAHRNLNNFRTAQKETVRKLSSGYRINSGADDAAGLAISERMRSQQRGLNQAMNNAQNANSLIQTSEGALNETNAVLQRMRELVVQAANGTNTKEDIKEIQSEITHLKRKIDRIADNTEFNTKTVLDGGTLGRSLEYPDQENNYIKHQNNPAENTNNNLIATGGENIENLNVDVEDAGEAIVDGAEIEVSTDGDPGEPAQITTGTPGFAIYDQAQTEDFLVLSYIDEDGEMIENEFVVFDEPQSDLNDWELEDFVDYINNSVKGEIASTTEHTATTDTLKLSSLGSGADQYIGIEGNNLTGAWFFPTDEDQGSDGGFEITLDDGQNQQVINTDSLSGQVTGSDEFAGLSFDIVEGEEPGGTVSFTEGPPEEDPDPVITPQAKQDYTDGAGLTFQIGANPDQNISLEIPIMYAQNLGANNNNVIGSIVVHSRSVHSTYLTNVLAFSFLRSAPQLLTAAPKGGLKPAPECRSRGALPHLLQSMNVATFSISSKL